MNNIITARLENFFNYFRNAADSDAGATATAWDTAYDPAEKSPSTRSWRMQRTNSRDRSLHLPNRLAALDRELNAFDELVPYSATAPHETTTV